MPVGNQVESSARLQVLATVLKHVSTGKIIHRMLQMKGRVAQNQLRGLSAVVDEAVTLKEAYVA